MIMIRLPVPCGLNVPSTGGWGRVRQRANLLPVNAVGTGLSTVPPYGGQSERR
jgi:hypothetical protein